MVTGVDEQFGRILECLKEQSLAEDTIVVFTSDHGNCLGCHEQISKNVYYEESMRIPFLIRWPNRIRPRHDNLLISVPDIYPTLLELMGLKDDIPNEIDGLSQASIFLTGKGTRPVSQWYLHVPVGQPAWGKRGIRTHRYTLVINKVEKKPSEYMLHDNVKDPFQLNNIADEIPEVVNELNKELEIWLQKNNDPWLKS